MQTTAKPPLTARQEQILTFIKEYQAENQRPPTFRTIGNRFGIRSPNGVASVIDALEKKGYLARNRNTWVGIRLLDLPNPAQRIAELEAQVAELRDTIRLIIGQENNIPWTEVPQTEVDGFLAELRRIKERLARETVPG